MRRFAWQDQTDEQDTGIDVTPMLDVVFILLIFFIVTASFVKETGVEVTRPTADTGTSREGANIVVAIDNQDRVWIDQRQVGPHAVEAHVARLHARNPQGSVVIQADAASNTETLVTVMDGARAAGVSDIAIATRSGR